MVDGLNFSETTMVFDCCDVVALIKKVSMVAYVLKLVVKKGIQTGYTSVVRGEILYVLKCIQTKVRIREAGLCYEEIPVVYKNKNMFLFKLNLQLQSHGNKVE